MRKYIIFTDSSADLTKEMSESLGIRTIQLDVIMEGEKPAANDQVDIKDFYAKQRAKKSATTAAVGMDRFMGIFEEAVKEDLDILYLGFSSGLSSTFNAGAVAIQELSEKYPDRKLYAVDTLCASLGEGMLVYLACKLKESGADIETVRDYVENNKMNLCHWFTVDDLFFLKRGGRVSAATAVVGSLLSIKPVMHVDNEGHLVKVGVARGRRASIKALFDKMKNNVIKEQSKKTYICHGDCLSDAEALRDMILSEGLSEEVVIGYTGAVIGSHSGPGTLALFYVGRER